MTLIESLHQTSLVTQCVVVDDVAHLVAGEKVDLFDAAVCLGKSFKRAVVKMKLCVLVSSDVALGARVAKHFSNSWA